MKVEREPPAHLSSDFPSTHPCTLALSLTYTPALRSGVSVLEKCTREKGRNAVNKINEEPKTQQRGKADHTLHVPNKPLETRQAATSLLSKTREANPSQRPQPRLPL